MWNISDNNLNSPENGNFSNLANRAGSALVWYIATRKQKSGTLKSDIPTPKVCTWYKPFSSAEKTCSNWTVWKKKRKETRTFWRPCNSRSVLYLDSKPAIYEASWKERPGQNCVLVKKKKLQYQCTLGKPVAKECQYASNLRTCRAWKKHI